MGDELFEGPETIGEVLAKWRREALADIEALPADLLRSRNPEDLEAEALERWRVNTIALDWDAITSEASEVELADGIHHGAVTGTKVTLFVPFQGPPGLFHLRASTHPEKPPRGAVRSGESLLLDYSYVDADSATVKRELDQQVAAVKECVSSINSDVDVYNAQLRGLIHDALKARLDKLQAADEVVAALAVPRRPHHTSGSGAIANPSGRADNNQHADAERHRTRRPGNLPKPQDLASRAPRRPGRPPGPHLVATRADIEKAYRKRWASGGRRPYWKEVARELGVDERTLRKARRSLGLDDAGAIDKLSD